MIADKMAIPRPAVKRTGSEMDQEPCLSVGLEALASGGAVRLKGAAIEALGWYGSMGSQGDNWTGYISSVAYPDVPGLGCIRS